MISPANAESWVLGTTRNIVWNISDVNLGQTVKIELLKDGAAVKTIADSAPAGADGFGQL